MAYYAVKQGKVPGIYKTWEECQKQVNGYSGAIFKKFKNKKEAENFIGNGEVEVSKEQQQRESELRLDWEEKTEQLDNISDMKYKGELLYRGSREKIEKPKKDEVIAFVDGSFKDNRGIGYGAILILNGINNYVKLEGRLDKEHKWNKYRNVAGELTAALLSTEWAVENKKKEIEICYDYRGIEDWALGNWKAKNDLTQSYVEAMQSFAKDIKISFRKIDAHSGNFYNEVADRLASI